MLNPELNKTDHISHFQLLHQSTSVGLHCLGREVKNLGCLFQCLLGRNRSVCLNLYNQFLVVGLLLHTIVLNFEPNVFNGSVDGVNSNESKLSLGWGAR